MFELATVVCVHQAIPSHLMDGVAGRILKQMFEAREEVENREECVCLYCELDLNYGIDVDEDLCDALNAADRDDRFIAKLIELNSDVFEDGPCNVDQQLDLMKLDFEDVVQKVVIDSRGKLPFLEVEGFHLSHLIAPGNIESFASFITADEVLTHTMDLWMEEQRNKLMTANS